MLKFALAGNPNCGKTTLFNSLTDSTAHVGNWPGVTVDKLEGVYYDLENGNLGTHADFSPTAYNGYYTKPDDFIENWCFRTGCHGDRMLEKLDELVLKADEFIQCVVNNVDELDHKVQN